MVAMAAYQDAAVASESQIYLALPEGQTRVLLLHPHIDPGAPIECTLAITDLHSQKKTFGPRSRTETTCEPERTAVERPQDLALDSAPEEDCGPLVHVYHVYEAPPYCLGDASKHFRIHCNGGTIMVRENLFHALLRIRHKQYVRRLCIDALCISQCDLEERGRQVSHMNLIFRLATRVLVWLEQDSDLHD